MYAIQDIYVEYNIYLYFIYHNTHTRYNWEKYIEKRHVIFSKNMLHIKKRLACTQKSSFRI
jgi:hypothetical protein